MITFECGEIIQCEGRYYPPHNNIITTENPRLIELLKQRGYSEAKATEGLDSKTIAELKLMLDEKRIKYNNRAKKQELIDLIGGEINE